MTDQPLDWLREAAHGFYDAKFGPGERRWIDDQIDALTPSADLVGAADALVRAWHTPMKDYWRTHQSAFDAMVNQIGPRIEVLAAALANRTTSGLDAAWAEAEAVTPEGWLPPTLIPAMELDRVLGPKAPYPLPVTRWRASTMKRDWTGGDMEATGPTPAAALRALADRLAQHGSVDT